MTYTKFNDVDLRAMDAVRLGRILAVELPDLPLELPDTLAAMLPASLARFAAGEVFAKADETTLTLLLAAFRQTLNGYGAGYGDFWLREKTTCHPFHCRDREAVRSCGEQLKSFIAARSDVVTAVLAERQVVILRRM